MRLQSGEPGLSWSTASFQARRTAAWVGLGCRSSRLRLNRAGRSGSLWQPSPLWSEGLPVAQQYSKGDRCRFLGASRGLKVRTLYGNAKMR